MYGNLTRLPPDLRCSGEDKQARRQGDSEEGQHFPSHSINVLDQGLVTDMQRIDPVL